MRGALEVADIFRRHGAAYRDIHAGHLSRAQRRVMGAIEACRTAALGGHVEQCDGCGQIRIAYNSCRNRHCPKCQGLARAEWLADRQADLLPVAVLPCRLYRAGARSPRSPSRTRRWSTPSCSRRRPRRCASSPPIPSISVPRSVWSRCCTLGDRTCIIIPMFTASCRVAGPLLTGPAGSPAGPGSFCL